MNDNNEVYGYIRVSTARQGQQGSSLQEQRAAIERYAERRGLSIVTWFEEQETAAKQGRRNFARMLSLLKRGRASGVIIHKIDRGARNLKDWADLGELIDQGIQVHFANDNLDLLSRSGRLSADIQAVVAADYIRNLREEVLKGFHGRLKQGLYPLPAPLGYRDHGGGKPKTPDPVFGPLVRRAFELYASGQYSTVTLSEEMHRLGLRSRRGSRITKSRMAEILRNPFYIGLIRIKRINLTIPGIHEPLISKELFNRVQARLDGRCNVRLIRHDFLFRRLLRCALCGFALSGEMQKGITYYRCHTPTCPTTGIREDRVEIVIRTRLAAVQITDTKWQELLAELSRIRGDWTRQRQTSAEAIKLQLAALTARNQRLTDAYVDGMIDKDAYQERREQLAGEIAAMKRSEEALTAGPEPVLNAVQEFLERAKSLNVSYEMGIPTEKREIVETATSNRLVSRKNLAVELQSPFREVAEYSNFQYGGPNRDELRTLNQSKLGTGRASSHSAVLCADLIKHFARKCAISAD